MAELRDMGEDEELLFDKKDIEDMRTHQNFQWDINRILKRERTYRSRKGSYRGRNRQNFGRRGNFERPWRQDYHQKDRRNDSYGGYSNKNRFSRHTGPRRGRGRGF